MNTCLAIFKQKIELRERCNGVHFVESRRELSNAYLLAKFGFDTAENEPFKARQLDTEQLSQTQHRWSAKDTFKGAKVSWTFNGLLLDRVHDGEAADRHGMVDGDLVIAINGMVFSAGLITGGMVW